MFTGLVADLGEVRQVERSDDGVRLRVATPLAGELGVGDSVAVNGVCLTATELHEDAFTTEVMNETLRRTSLADVRTGGVVNLELALRASDRLGGTSCRGTSTGRVRCWRYPTTASRGG